MEKAQRTQASRRGHRAHLTKLLKKTDEIMTNESSSEMDMATLQSITEQLEKKKAILKELDAKIITLIEQPDDLEQEIIDSEDIQSNIIEKTCQVRKFFDLKQAIPPQQPTASSPSTSFSSVTSPQEENQQQIFAPSNVQPQKVLAPPNVQPQQVLAPPNVQPQQVFPPPDVPPQQVFPQNLPSQEISTQSSTPQVSLQPATVQSTPSFSTHTTQNTLRLPILSLPTFNGNPLQWQTFWDSFNAAVHSNSNLSGVEKFNYLKAQTSGEAARAISGFPLTNTNYEQAIALLNERFGQSYKIVNAHMQALLNIPTPTNSLTSIRQFHDTIENRMRGLSALGKSEETYGDLLIPIILGKLPAELQRNLAREQNNGTWTINLLRQAILKEIRIMKASNSINDQTKAFEEPNPPSMTTLFHTKVNSPTPVLPHTPSTPGKSEPFCVYCNGKH